MVSWNPLDPLYIFKDPKQNIKIEKKKNSIKNFGKKK